MAFKVSIVQPKNTLGIYRLDHDADLHDDQAIALALGTHHLLDADAGSAETWIRWAKAKAEKAIAGREARELEERAAIKRGPAGLADPADPAGQEPPLEGVVLDPVAARKLARDAAFREQQVVLATMGKMASPARP